MKNLLHKAKELAIKYYKNNVEHLDSVYNILLEFGVKDKEILTASWLHSLIYDTHTDYTYIKENFGEEIAELVYLMTPEIGRTEKESNKKTYIKIKGNYKAIILKLSDRLANIKQSKNKNLDSFIKYKEDQEYLEIYLTLKGIILNNVQKGNTKHITNLANAIITEFYK